MATWTEILERATPDGPRAVDVTPEGLRDLLLDLPYHPNLACVRSITVEVNTGMAVQLRLPGDESMASGASGPITPGAGVQRDTVQPWRVTPVLGDAGVEAVRAASETGLGVGWLEGIKFYPPGETTRRLADDKPLIILGDK